ncbi:MAG: hypothetical protein QGH60_00765 [Phycisphaerae bacterium]|jgi:hypothetical protein|nr:hypothetical protein [Phycisphaerae bacterium]
MNDKTRYTGKVAFSLLIVALLTVLAGMASADAGKSGLLKACASEKYKFTPKVRSAFLAYARSQALADLKAGGKSLPKEFLAWVDADAEIQAGVYTGHDKPSDVLLHLYSLRLDLGKVRFEKYRQLALAAAIVNAKSAADADITPRKGLKIVIGGDPRKLVNTKESGRKLDKNDHIINFLNDNTIEEEVVVGHKEVVPELKYDKRGIAIPQPRKKKPKKVPVIEKRKRSLYAADVLASKDLQTKFNTYMKSKGHPTDIDCGDKVVHWKSRDAVRGPHRKSIANAYKLFRGAYEAKGLLPAARDPIPSPAERCLYIIRNYEYKFSPGIQARRKHKWPQFPITAPWPVMTLLVDDNQPLREREERWIAFRDKGEFKKYGEYIGAIAQQFDMQSARRLKPHPFTYHTAQMMLKDGGVCGTMGALSARSHISLGIPACQAIQPGHCAMVAFGYDAKKKIYFCRGQQYATGGDEKTTPFARWYFGDPAKKYARRLGFGVQPNPRKPMVYHQSVAWAVNHGVKAFGDSTMAHAVYQLLGEPERKGAGRTLLTSALAINPYNFVVTDAAQAAASTPTEQVDFWRTFQTLLTAAGDTAGCKPDGLYSKTVKTRVFASIAKLPVPSDKSAAKEIYTFLQTEKCDAPAAMVKYRLAAEGLAKLLTKTEAEYKKHLIDTRAAASTANDTACRKMSEAVKSTAAAIKDKKKRTQWALKLWKQSVGNEKYFGRWMRVNTDRAVSTVAGLAGKRLPKDPQLMQNLLDRLAAELKASIAGKRDHKTCRLLASKIKAAAKYTKDPAQKRKWAQAMSKIIKGKETYNSQPTKKKPRLTRDPCADEIKKLLAAS